MCATRQDQKGRLRSVLRLMLFAQNALAGAQDHCPMAVDDRREGGLRRLGCRVPLVDKSLQQLAVGQAGGRALPPECSDVLVDRRARLARHPMLPHRVYVCIGVPTDRSVIPELRKIFISLFTAGPFRSPTGTVRQARSAPGARAPGVRQRQTIGPCHRGWR